MGRNTKRRTRYNDEKKSNKIIRCLLQNQPKFEHEVCAQFNRKTSANDINNCKNCTHSF